MEINPNSNFYTSIYRLHYEVILYPECNKVLCDMTSPQPRVAVQSMVITECQKAFDAELNFHIFRIDV